MIQLIREIIQKIVGKNYWMKVNFLLQEIFSIAYMKP